MKGDPYQQRLDLDPENTDADGLGWPVDRPNVDFGIDYHGKDLYCGTGAC